MVCEEMFRKLSCNKMVSDFFFSRNFYHQIFHFNRRKPFCPCNVLSIVKGNYGAATFTKRPDQNIGYQYENEYFHSIMENMSSYRDVIRRPVENKLDLSEFGIGKRETGEIEAIVTRFVNISVISREKQLSLEDFQFKDLVQAVVRVLPSASNKQIFQTLMFLGFWRTPTEVLSTVNYKFLWRSLDSECVSRLKSWTIKEKLLVAELLFHLQLKKKSQYNRELIKDLLPHSEDLSVQQLIQLMFFVNLQRDVPQNMLIPLEKKWHSIIKEISIQELGIICLGYFKTQNKIMKMEIVQIILWRTIEELEQLNSFVICGLVKFLRKSFYGELTELYITLVNKCVTHVNKWDIYAGIHIALLSSEMYYYNPVLLDVITENISKNMNVFRLKDATKLLSCLSMFNHIPKAEFTEKYEEEMLNPNREQELHFYPRDLFYSLLFYAYLGHYSCNLLKKALNPSFVDYCIKTNGISMSNPISVLDYCVEIEAKNYKGPRISDNILKRLRNSKGNLPSENLKNSTLHARLVENVFKTLCELFGNDHNVCVKHILPHMFSPDVIVRLNPSKNSLPLAKIFHDVSPEAIIIPPSEEVWLALMVCAKYAFAYKSQKLNGVNTMKQRQLLKLGYTVSVVPYFKVQDTSQHKQYLLEQLRSAGYKSTLNNNCQSLKR